MANERTYQPIGHVALLPRGGLLRDSTTQDFALGTEVRDNRGNIFRYIKASEALVEGDALTPVAEAAWDSTTVVDGAGSAGDTMLHVDTNTSAFTANQFAGYYVTMATAASKGKSYRIKGHAAMDASSEVDIFLDDPLSEAMADGGILLIYNPWLYEKVDASTEIIRGVAIGAITSGSYGWVQVGGYFQAIKAGHSTSDAIVLNEVVMPIGTDNEGAVEGAVSSNAEADVHEASQGLIALRAVAANTTGFITAYSRGIL